MIHRTSRNLHRDPHAIAGLVSDRSCERRRRLTQAASTHVHVWQVPCRSLTAVTCSGKHLCSAAGAGFGVAASYGISDRGR